MSTILKALRRLERERAKDVARPLREEVMFSRPRSGGRWGIWGLIGAALVLGFVGTWAALPPATDDRADVPTGAAATAPPAAMSGSPAPLPPVAAAAAAPASPARAPSTAQPAVPAPPFEFAAPEIEPLPVVSGAVAAAAPSEPARAIPRAEPRDTPAEAIEDDLVIVAPIEGRASRIVDEEPATRRALADVPVRVVRTSWHPRADRRAAWVAIGGADPREVREGEWIGALEIRTIEPDGILFADGPLLVHRSIGER